MSCKALVTFFVNGLPLTCLQSQLARDAGELAAGSRWHLLPDLFPGACLLYSEKAVRASSTEANVRGHRLPAGVSGH